MIRQALTVGIIIFLLLLTGCSNQDSNEIINPADCGSIKDQELSNNCYLSLEFSLVPVIKANVQSPRSNDNYNLYNNKMLFIHNSNYWPTGVYNAVTLIKLNQVDYDLLVNNFKNIYEQEKAKGLVLIDVPIHSFQIQMFENSFNVGNVTLTDPLPTFIYDESRSDPLIFNDLSSKYPSIVLSENSK